MPPRGLNPFQRLLVAPWFVYALLLYVALLGVGDVWRMGRVLIDTPGTAVAHVSSTAIRLVLAGVFFELRGNFVKHLLGEEAARDPRNAHMSEACEIFGGYLTVAGLFVELIESTRELFPAGLVVNASATASTILLSLLSLHVMFDLVRTLRHGA